MTNAGWGSYEPKGGEIFCSPSRLILFREDPELYKYRYIDKEDKDTKLMELGTLIHKAVLEPGTFQDDYMILPEKTEANDLDTKALKALCEEYGLKVSGTKAEKLERLREAGVTIEPQFDELMAAMADSGKILVPHHTLKKALAIKEKIYSHPKVGPWVQLSQKEKRGWFEINDVIMRFQIDGFFEHNGVGVVWDLKTTKDWEKRRFERNLFENGFHIQLELYRKAIKAIENKEINAFMIIAVETTAPFRVRYYQLDAASLDAAALEIDVYLKEYKERLQANDFSARKEDIEIQTVSLQSWNWDAVNSLET